MYFCNQKLKYDNSTFDVESKKWMKNAIPGVSLLARDFKNKTSTALKLEFSLGAKHGNEYDIDGDIDMLHVFFWIQIRTFLFKCQLNQIYSSPVKIRLERDMLCILLSVGRIINHLC